MTTTQRYAVIGDPIDHSLSPRIHMAFAKQLGLDFTYTKFAVTAASFSPLVNAFFVEGGRGLNVTAPLKALAFNYADLVTDRAMNAAAVNTLKYFDDDIVFGDNTDGEGLVRDLELNLGVPLAGRNLLVLGAGGAVRGCLGALLQRQPHKICLYNRTISKAKTLVDVSSHPGNLKLLSRDYDDKLKFDVIINGTSASISDNRPDIDQRYLQDAVCYDMVYGRSAQPFLKWVLAHGAKSAHDGLGMLVEQAAESCYVWHEQRPATTDLLEELRAAVADSH